MNPTEFAQKIDLLIKVLDVAPSNDEKIIFLQMCQIKKLLTILILKLFETVNFAFMKTFDFFVKIAFYRVFLLFLRDWRHAFLPRLSVGLQL